MDQDLAWWVSVVFDGWRDRPGPRYQRLAAALLDAISRRRVAPGTRVPADRVLAAAVGVSRGTMVACFDQLVETGVLRRRTGAGTYVVGRPSWADARPAGSVAELLLRRMAADGSAIDLSASSPGDLRHLPAVDAGAAWRELDGNGLDPRGLATLRAAVARHLSEHQRLPSQPDQIIITNGAQEALWLLGRVLRPTRVLASCPTYPGLPSAFGGSDVEVTGADLAGAAARGAARGVARGVARSGAGECAYVMPTGHNPTGVIMPAVRRHAYAAAADAGRVTVVEDLTLADLYLDQEIPPAPLSALSPAVIAVGSVSKLLWGGLRVGWIRAGSEPLREALEARKSAANLATSSLAQAVAAQLLDNVDSRWLALHRGALARRRDHLCALLGDLLPAWQVAEVPAAGLSLWVGIPVEDAAAFAHIAYRYGVVVATGAAACLDGRHRGYIRLSFAERLDTLSLAAERLAVAWAVHAENLAAGLVS